MAALDLPAPWVDSVERVREHHWRKILVLGDNDTGKSTYCRYLVSQLTQAGARVVFLDADIGQKDVGPPATIALADHGVALSEPEPTALYFVGDTTPVGHLAPILVGVMRLLAAAQSDFVVIDTTGLVLGPGRVLKTYKIAAIDPDVIVALQRDRELEPTLHAQRHRPVLRLPVSDQAVSKSLRERRLARGQRFAAHFARASILALALDEIVIQRTRLFTGRRFDDPRCLYAERDPDGVLAIAARPLARQRWTVLPPDCLQGLLCGVADARERCLGLGRIEGVDFRARRLQLLTPVPAEAIRLLQFGDLYLAADYSERHGRLGRHW